ncbi:hypothetical protein RI138_22125 [Streptomyces sp. C11-1]|uniref:Uncharacterized protein n=1 Tax=Streptomyces durocortorensis TaxID=2811104 RepID=A0ABY9W265_9ACTN|nr:hypothetical protein [Streptomyces durocortorensis]WNF29302.1 hypothetical protein RI138_22125 [Streptomyces durocortorensis]
MAQPSTRQAKPTTTSAPAATVLIRAYVAAVLLPEGLLLVGAGAYSPDARPARAQAATPASSPAVFD